MALPDVFQGVCSLSWKVTRKSFLKNGMDSTKIMPLIQEGFTSKIAFSSLVLEIRIRTFIGAVDALSVSLTDRYKKSERKSHVKHDTASLLMIIYACR
jgi:hypothetical protein